MVGLITPFYSGKKKSRHESYFLKVRVNGRIGIWTVAPKIGFLNAFVLLPPSCELLKKNAFCINCRIQQIILSTGSSFRSLMMAS